MRDLDEAKMLLELAEQDYQALQIMRKQPAIAERIFGFHAQQAVEKALKAWLSIIGVEFPFTHSLNILFVTLEDEVGSDVQQFRYLEMLTPFAVQFRYSAYEGSEPELDREDIVRRVDDLLKHVNVELANSQQDKL